MSADRERWTGTFEAIAHGQGNENLSLPWSVRSGYALWAGYLEEERPLRIGARRAWSLLLPLRARSLAAAKPDVSIGGRAAVEAFVYPLGVGAIVNVAVYYEPTTAPDGLSLGDAVLVIRALRENKLFVLPGPEGRAVRLRVDEIAERAIAEARTNLLVRPPRSPVVLDPSPFSVVSVVQASGRVPAAQDGGELHRALDSFAGGSGRVGSAKLKRFMLREESLTDRDLLYGRARGRVIWFPERFRPHTGSWDDLPHFLGSYHRSLVIASLQTESLLGLMAALGQRLREGYGPALPYWLRACAKNAAGSVGRIYGGGLWTEHAASLRAQIEQANRGSLRTDADRVRDYFDMPALHASDAQLG